MLCVTGFETSASAWRARADARRQHMHELRLDALSQPEQALRELGTLPPNTLACCRPQRQGGRYAGSETARLALLRQAQQQGASWIDVEADVPDHAISGWPCERILRSWHDHTCLNDSRLRDALARLVGRSGGYKLAVTVADVTQLEPLLAVRPQQPAVLLAMGPAGLLSRCRYRAFGSAWSYVASDATHITAAGQLSLSQALRWGVNDAAERPLLALLGGEQVLRSPGPDVYNPLLQQRGMAGIYLPLITQQLGPALQLLRRLGGMAASVTMPLKRDALALCQPDAQALLVGAVNSLAWRGGRWHGTNTDVAGVRLPLERAMARLRVAPTRALILGAGGAAAAALVATRQLGLHTTVAARDPAAAATLKPDASVAWSQRGEVTHQLLINATAVAGDASPWPAGALPRAQLVLDMALTASRLLQDARAAGAITISGQDMWLAQGAQQISWMLGANISEAQLRAQLPAPEVAA